jgi:hypothetical protein
VQLATPQTFAEPPPPHVSFEGQVPQLMLPPQPSGQEPQFFPAGQDVAGVHAPHWYGWAGLPPQV